MSEKITRPSQRLLTHFQEIYNSENLHYVENDLSDSVEYISKYFEVWHSIGMDLQTGKLKYVEEKDSDKPSKYTPVYHRIGHDRMRTFEFIHFLNKEELDEINKIIKDFNKHKEEVNTVYYNTRKTVPDQYRQFLLFTELQKPKPAFVPSTLSTSVVFMEFATMTNQERILAEFINAPHLDAFNLPFYL